MVEFTDSDREFMARALRLAERGRGHTAPNPMVGAVIVKDGKLISEGYHSRAGDDHAEIDAINKSSVPLKGSTMYVTLEPCTVSGRTPPCTDELIKQGFSRVVLGTIDPNPEVNGTGIEKMEAAGIRVECGLFEKEAQKQNEVFFKNMLEGMPFVCAKIASSIDGKLAASSSDSKWITSVVSRKAVQALRHEYGCILTGINTVLADNPSLFPKQDPGGSFEDNMAEFLAKEESPSFTRVVLDRNLRIPADSVICQTAESIRTVVFTGSREKSSEPCGNFSVEHKGGGGWEPRDILKVLYDKYKITSVMLEAGPSVLTSFLNYGLIDKFVFFLAPRIIGGDSPYGMFGNTGVKDIKDSLGLRFDSINKSGKDIVVTAYPEDTRS